MFKVSFYFLLLLLCSSFAFALAHQLEGVASYYGRKFNGKRTSNGELHWSDSLVCAHRTLPFNTIVLVTNVNNGKQVKVRVNDRGPFIKGRVIDLSNAAADSIGLFRTGTAKVILEIIN